MTATVVIPAQRTPDPAERWQTVTRAQQGDREAFADLYRTYADVVFRYVYARTSHRQLAEDITSTVFERALRRIDSVTWQGTDFGAWLVTIARNLVADHYKSSRHRLEITVGDVLGGEDRADRSPEGDPARTVAAHDTNLTLLAAVKRLNAEQQECIRLRFLCGLSVIETATAVGKQEGAIKALQYRSVRSLRRLLDGSGVTPW
ncbi:MAG TPA: sigma-70 family RNA polymerase sigma factor [Pseudonocardia sp.]